MRISDWSSDVCSSDLGARLFRIRLDGDPDPRIAHLPRIRHTCPPRQRHQGGSRRADQSSEEHTSELQSLMRISYAVFCLKKKILITRTLIYQPNQKQHYITQCSNHKP